MPANFRFDGFSSPNYTQIPDEFFDLIAPQLTEPELRVLLYVMRRILGFKKSADDISLRQIVEGIRTRDGRVLDLGAGVSKPSAIKGLRGLVEKGVIVAQRNRSEERGDEATTYTLHFKGQGPVSTRFTGGVNGVDTGGVNAPDRPRVNGVYPQETVEEQETAKQETDTTPSNSKELTRKKVRERGKGASGFASTAPPPTVADHTTRPAEKPEKRSKRPRVVQSTTAPENAPILGTQGLQGMRQRPTDDAVVDEQLAALTATMQQLSEKLGDERHWRSNVSQARHILEESGLNPNAWTALAWSVYHRTAEQQGRLKRPMAWFFKAFHTEVAERTAPRKSLLASFSADPPRKSLAGQYEHLVHR